MSIFAKTCCLGACIDISFVDSTHIRVCSNKHIKRNKVFKDLATTGKSTVGWVYGFKFHIIINDKGEIISFCITQANVDDREPLKNKGFLKKVFGKLFTDKDYIQKQPFEILLVTSIRNNMKNSLMTMSDKLYLKRSVIETEEDLQNIHSIYVFALKVLLVMV